MVDSTTNLFRMRPVYDWVTAGTPEAFVAQLGQLASFDPAVNISARSRHAVLSIPEECRHTWSPVLDITVLNHGDRTHVHARLGPEPEVWSSLMFAAAATFFPCMFATMFGIAQQAMGEPPWGLLGLPIGAVGLGAVYAASFVGKKLSAAQIHQLLAVVEANLSVDAEWVEHTHELPPPGQSGSE